MVASVQLATSASPNSPTTYSASTAARDNVKKKHHQNNNSNGSCGGDPPKQQRRPSTSSTAAAASLSYAAKAAGAAAAARGGGGVPSPLSNGHHRNHNHHQQQQAPSSSSSPPRSSKLTPHEERIRKLMLPPPTSMTLTAALQLLQPKSSHQSVYLMDREYLQNWLLWAYHQPIAASASSSSAGGGPAPANSEQARVHEALRLAAVQEGLTPPNDYNSGNNIVSTGVGGGGINGPADHFHQMYCDPGPIDATALSVEGHPLLLSPFVQVSEQSSCSPSSSSTSAILGGPISFTRTQSARSNVSSSPGGPGAALDGSDPGRGGSSTIDCLAVPEAFYDTLRSVHGVLCDDGYSVTFQAEDTERLLLHHQPYLRSSHLQQQQKHIRGLQQQRESPPRPIEFRRKLVPLCDDNEDDNDGDGVRDPAAGITTPTNNRNSSSGRGRRDSTASLMDKLLADEEQRRHPRCCVEVHPLKLMYAQWNSDLNRVEPAGFGLVSRQALAVDALASLLRAAYPHKATQAVRLWCKCSYAEKGGRAALKEATQRRQEQPTQNGVDGYELIDLQSLESRRLLLQEWVQHLIPPAPGTSAAAWASSGANRKFSRYNEVQLLVETRPTVNNDWPRRDLDLSERIKVGDFVDAQDVAGKWYEAVVRQVEETHLTVHYVGWASRWDAKVRRRHEENGIGAPSRVQPPAPLWTRTARWREGVRVGQMVEVRDSSSRAERPKWYKGIIRVVGNPNDPVRDLKGGAELETYADPDDPDRKERLRLLHRTRQVLVEVEQEKTQTNTRRARTPNANGKSPGTGLGDLETDEIKPEPPYLRWIDLYGEEICKLGTHLKHDSDSHHGRPVTIQYEYESNRKPVEVLKSHPALGSGFMRESLRGTPPAPGSVGLQNLGNSCFLNSTVQCLNHIEPLTQYFLQDKHMRDLNRKNPLGSGGNVALAYASLLKKMWGGEYSVLAPRTLKQTVANFAPQFDNCYQHDCQEFCQFLMDGLHEDLNRVKSKPYVEELEGFGMEDQKAAIESWRKHLLRHDSIIVDHCQGMHRSHLTCPRCGRESIKFDVFSSISLPLATSKKRNSIQLEDCLEQFMEGEQLDERNAWYCPKCRQHVCALKMIALWSVPDILILHLKRFTFDTCMSSGGMLRSKMDDKVVFPISSLDLTKHILGPIDPQAPPVYRLFGVSEHVGPTANSGHYTATVRNSIDQQWYRCNDSHVGLTSGEASITGGAYLLFYQRTKGISKWAGMEKAMRERGVNPYGGLETDQDGFTPVKKTKKKTSRRGGSTSSACGTSAGEESSRSALSN